MQDFFRYASRRRQLQFPLSVVGAAFIITIVWFLRDHQKQAILRAIFGRAPANGIPLHIPVVGVPVTMGRGRTFVAAMKSVFAPGNPPVRRLVICDSSLGSPDIKCALDTIREMLPATTELTVLQPSPKVGTFLSVSECWNAIAEATLVQAREPWIIMLNDDVGFAPGELATGTASIWAHHATHAAVFVNHREPGVGNFFSAFALSRLGYLGVGPFDENYFPAYFEVNAHWLSRYCARYHDSPPPPPTTTVSNVARIATGSTALRSSVFTGT
jgi:hypothetical protein